MRPLHFSDGTTILESFHRSVLPQHSHTPLVLIRSAGKERRIS